jgi:hypothetical protein
MVDFSKEREENHSKKIDDASDEKVRILQDNLVFVNALPCDTSTKEVPDSPRRPSKRALTSADTVMSAN